MIVRPRPLGTALVLDTGQLCFRCLYKIARPASGPVRQKFSTSTRRWSNDGSTASVSKPFQREYFSSHQPVAGQSPRWRILTELSKRREQQTASQTQTLESNVVATETTQSLPHRRRKRIKEEDKIDANEEQQLPLDASARLSAFSFSLPTASLRRKLAAYFALTKPRLSFLILLSTTSAYGLYPISTLLDMDPSASQLPTLSTSTLTFLYLTVGTFMSSASANAFNMLLEPKYDAMMSRTRTRPLVRGLVSRYGAVIFAIASGVIGVSLLYVGTNPTVAALSGGNIILYGFIYTPMKRIHVINTWIGAVVGAIPPMMGWVAAEGLTATTGHDSWKDMLFSKESIGGWLLAAVLFAWQFPHFNSLSHLIREEYRAAGHQMMAWVNPARNARVSLRYSVLMFPIAFGVWYIGIVNNLFLVSSTLANGWLVREAYKFWKYQGGKGSARGLFWASVWQLPIFLVGALVTKKGVWDGVWRRVAGADDEEDFYDEYDEGEEQDVRLVRLASAPKA
ncbi:hypothetical protein VTN31DRAFT_2977 [Thermomyces dupontii]|uniref:uncharacterized protein n=1 Tax=Talaromyces thermophilus TaxID=28565 RepID=UPI00374480D3